LTPLAISVIVLWIVVLSLLAVVFALTRQLGVLHERIAPVGALMLNRGLTGRRAGAGARPRRSGRGQHSAGRGARRRQEHLAAVRFTHLPGMQVSAAHRQIERQARARLARDHSGERRQSDEHRAYVRSNDLGKVPYVLSAPWG